MHCKNSYTLKCFIFFSFFICKPFVINAQHGSGGAGALGVVLFDAIYFLIFLVLLILFYINVFAITDPKRPSRSTINTFGLILSVILLIVQLAYLTDLSSYIPLRLFFTVLSIFHLLFRILTQETD